jgi:cytochrome c553
VFYKIRKIVTTLVIQSMFLVTNVFAETYRTPAIPVPGGYFNSEVSAERQEATRQKNRKGIPDAGKEKSLFCEGCHGESGNSTDPLIPKLAGQYGNYIIKQIRNYQSGRRTHGIMSAMATTMSDDDLFDAAAYYSTQKIMYGSRSAESELGKKLFVNSSLSNMGLACINCHGVRGKGLEQQISAFPVIGGQHKDYLRQQLQNFRDGLRTNSPNDIMNRITVSLTDAQIESLAEYVSGQ